MKPEQLKHLEFIQHVITRMNTNSFQIKGWAITIVSALLAIYASTKNEFLILTSIFPLIVFWLLDTYYLMQERKFRGIYNDVAGVSKNPKEYKAFEIRPDLYTGGKYCYCSSLFSTTILLFYLLQIVALLILFCYVFPKA